MSPDKMRSLADMGLVSGHSEIAGDAIDAVRIKALRDAADDIERLKDSNEGLACDLRLAVETAYRRGAIDWTKMNYPKLYAELSGASK